MNSKGGIVAKAGGGGASEIRNSKEAKILVAGGGGGGTAACSVSGGTTKVGSPSNVCNLCSSGNIATGGKYISLGSRGKRYEGSCTRLMYSDQNSLVAMEI